MDPAHGGVFGKRRSNRESLLVVQRIGIRTAAAGLDGTEVQFGKVRQGYAFDFDFRIDISDIWGGRKVPGN